MSGQVLHPCTLHPWPPAQVIVACPEPECPGSLESGFDFRDIDWFTPSGLLSVGPSPVHHLKEPDDVHHHHRL